MTLDYDLDDNNTLDDSFVKRKDIIKIYSRGLTKS